MLIGKQWNQLVFTRSKDILNVLNAFKLYRYVSILSKFTFLQHQMHVLNSVNVSGFVVIAPATTVVVATAAAVVVAVDFRFFVAC